MGSAISSFFQKFLPFGKSVKIPSSSFPMFCGRLLQRQPWRLEAGTFTLFATIRFTFSPAPQFPTVPESLLIAHACADTTPDSCFYMFRLLLTEYGNCHKHITRCADQFQRLIDINLTIRGHFAGSVHATCHRICRAALMARRYFRASINFAPINGPQANP